MQNMILLAKQLLVVYNITVLLGQTNEKAIIKQHNNYPPPPIFFYYPRKQLFLLSRK